MNDFIATALLIAVILAFGASLIITSHYEKLNRKRGAKFPICNYALFCLIIFLIMTIVESAIVLFVGLFFS